MAYLSITELLRLGGIRPELMTALTHLMANFEARTGQKSFVPADGGLRTEARQAELIADRGTSTYPVAAPGESRHEYGAAFDLNIIGQTTGDNWADSRNPYYIALAEEARALGLVAGIDFGNPDPYHFELNESLADSMAAWAALVKKNSSYWSGLASQPSRHSGSHSTKAHA